MLSNSYAYFIGGIAVILVGDILQLPPIRGNPIFLSPKNDQNYALWNSDSNLWNNFEVSNRFYIH